MMYQDSTSTNDTPQQIDFNPKMILEKLDSWLDGLVRLLPNIAMAIVVIVIFYFIGRWVKSLVMRLYKGKDRDNLGRMLSSLARYVVLIFGIMLGLTIIIPSLKPGDLIAGLGVSSVAIGFAFKDILQNWLAGLLILIRQPFEISDQIVVNDFEGTVERIETRATIIKTYAGERILIPNSEIYTTSVKVKTAYEVRRSQYDVGIGYGDDVDEAVEKIREAVEAIEELDKEKGVDVLPWGLDASWVTIRVRWWTKSDRASEVMAMMKVVKAIKRALDDAKIDMPYNTQVLLFHDQTEAADGDRSKQREGWPSDGNKGTTPRWKAKMKEKQHNDDSSDK